MATYKQIRDEVKSWLDEATNTSTTHTNVGYAINRAHQQRCTEANWPFMEWPQPETITLVASQRRYILHSELFKPIYMFNKTSKKYLVETPYRQLEASQARWNTDTGGTRYKFIAPSPVAVQPTAATTLTIVSSSASDTTVSKAVTIRGMTANGVLSETVTPTGTAAASTTNSYSLLLNVDLASAWLGTCTVATAGGTTLLTLPAGDTNRQYPQIELLWTPGDTDTVEYKFYRKPRTLSGDGDTVDIPETFSRILVFDSLLLFAAYDGDITKARLDIWVDQREKLLLAMQNTYLEGNIVAAEPRYIRIMGEDDGSVPQVWG